MSNILSGLLIPSIEATSSYSIPYFLDRWRYVRPRFEVVLKNLTLTSDQLSDGETKFKGVTRRLNQHYWDDDSESAHASLIGGWGKDTRVRPPRDVDMVFVLPYKVYERFQSRTGNRQSQLLAEIRDVLNDSYPTTIRADGQVVQLPFNSMTVEVAPVFLREGGGLIGLDTNEGGRYKWVDPYAELASLNVVDARMNGNVRKLARLMKLWQRHCNVDIASFHIEHVIKNLLPDLTYGASDEFWFDWLVRDTFARLVASANTFFYMPTTGEAIYLGDGWLSRAQTALDRAIKACAYEHDNKDSLAGEEWQKIFGQMIPRSL